MNNKIQKAAIGVIAIIIFFATFIGTSKEQVIVEAKKIVSDSNNIDNGYLIGAQTLKGKLGSKDIVVLDIRDSKQYDSGHITGAINISWDNFKKLISTNKSSSNNSNTTWVDEVSLKSLNKELQSLGVTKDSEVIIYGNSNGDDLGELGDFSKLFELAGINSKMLNGGFKNWEAEGFTTTISVPNITKSDIEITELKDINPILKNKDEVDKSYVNKNISKVKIVELINDVKEETNPSNSLNSNPNDPSQEVVQGENVKLKPISEVNKLNPPVKGVIQIKLSELLNPNGTIKPVSELQGLFSLKGINDDNIIVFYNTKFGDINFLSAILNMAGYNKTYPVNQSLSGITKIEANIKEAKESQSSDNNTQTTSTSSSQNSSNSSSNDSSSNNSSSSNSDNTNS